MNEQAKSMRSFIRGGLTILAAAAAYEIVARSGAFPAVLLPTIPTVAVTLYGMIIDGRDGRQQIGRAHV